MNELLKRARPLLAVLDQSALTGEPMPVTMQAGEAVLSGATNVGDAFDLDAARVAAESTYAGVAGLVVATPCPLILAVPVALVSGLSHAARQGILIKGGKAMETLARIRALVLDKPGALTRGDARIVDIRAADSLGSDELLRLAASLDQASKHIVARTIVA